ncbi:unnamed protein product [Macrosiphum euphorbiae]|uniref:Uncharacterized protein n=1 Tax=Macrosiphum euphorbiae TaxID=13131 RepID=A0AAV0X1Q7_9HEMI|nr:unnamed protein product [Macrosiphum euphorbiae]
MVPKTYFSTKTQPLTETGASGGRRSMPVTVVVPSRDFRQGFRGRYVLRRQHAKHSRTTRLTPLHAVENRDRGRLASGSGVVAPGSSPLDRSSELLLSSRPLAGTVSTSSTDAQPSPSGHVFDDDRCKR